MDGQDAANRGRVVMSNRGYTLDGFECRCRCHDSENVRHVESCCFGNLEAVERYREELYAELRKLRDRKVYL